MRRKSGGILFIISIVFLFIMLKLLLWSPAKSAETIVHDFYFYEQNGNFSDSWELLHPYMKEKFPKSVFIQDRAHVFIGHFGADTFTFEIGDVKEVQDWKPAKGEKPFKTAYRFVVKQDYAGKYGRFSFSQEVYVVEDKNRLVILWDYNK
jgi:hypothetical protein